MNNTSLVIFDLCHVVRNIRDTLEFTVPNKEIAVNVYNGRRQVVRSILDPKTFLGSFVQNNEEKLKEFKKNYEEFVDQVYSDDSTILVKTIDDRIRVDHGQDIVIARGVVYLGETIRDILFSHVEQARRQNQAEEPVLKLLDLDERIDRSVKMLVLLQLYEKSFAEFQKVMKESNGKPTPQSNFIVQNELSVLANAIRFVRDHCRMIDNKSLDIYDSCVALMQMCEGRRERRDNKGFPDLFKETIAKLGELINEFGPSYDQSYGSNLKEMLAQIEENKKKAEEQKA